MREETNTLVEILGGNNFSSKLIVNERTIPIMKKKQSAEIIPSIQGDWQSKGEVYKRKMTREKEKLIFFLIKLYNAWKMSWNIWFKNTRSSFVFSFTVPFMLKSETITNETSQ